MYKDHRLFEMFTAFVKQYQSGSSDAVITQGKEFQGTGQAGVRLEAVRNWCYQRMMIWLFTQTKVHVYHHYTHVDAHY